MLLSTCSNSHTLCQSGTVTYMLSVEVYSTGRSRVLIVKVAI